MDDIKTACIDSRKTAILSSITEKDEELERRVDEYFKKLEEFAKDCKDVTDFESKFATSDLAKEYADLFTIAMNPEPEKEPSLASEVGHEVADSVYHGARRQARQEAYDKVRDIPGIGDALTVKQHFDFFSRFKKKKDSNEE